MTKPTYQLIIEIASKIFTGILILGTFLDAISNAVNLLTPALAVIGSLTILLLWFLIEVRLRRYPLKWIAKDGQTVQLKRLGWGSRYTIIGIVLLLWLPLLVKSETRELNKNVQLNTQFRPLVVPELSGEITIEKNTIKNYVYMSNTGPTPAVNLYMYVTLNRNKQFPVDTIKSKTIGIETFKKAILFPNQKRIKGTFPTRLETKNLPQEGFSIDLIRRLMMSEDLYLHLYLTYESEEGDKYYLKGTYKLKYLKDTEDGMFADWIFIWSSTKPL